MKAIKTFLYPVGKFYGTFVATGVIVILVAIIFYLVYPFNIASINKISIVNQVQSGGIIIYKVDFCQNVGGGISREVHRYLEPTDTKSLNPVDLGTNPSIQTLASSQGCKTGAEVKLPIDTSIPPGEYKLLIRITYKFPLRDIPVEGESVPFTISKPDILGQLTNINSQLESINGYLQTSPDYTSSTPNSPVSNVAPSVDTPTGNQQTTQQRRGVLNSTIDSINGNTSRSTKVVAQGLDIGGFAAQTLSGSYGNPEPTLVRNKGTFIGQCVSYIRQGLSAMYEVNFGSLGDAVSWASANAQAKLITIGYTWVPNDTNFQNGDILVWGDDPGNFTGPEGHIAFWYQGRLLNQNYNGSLKVTQNGFFSAGYLGRYTKGEIMIQDTDAEYTRWGVTSEYIRGRTDEQGNIIMLTRDEFRLSAVGRTWLNALEILEDSSEASDNLAVLKTGKQATKDNWVGQITSLQAQLKEAEDQSNYVKVSDLYIKKGA